MNKTLLIALAGALSIGTPTIRAQSGASVNAPTVTANVSVVSQYMFRGQRLGGLSFQPSVELGGMAGGGLTAGVWVNKPISNRVPNVSDPEVDLYGSYTLTMSESLSVVPGFTYYFYPELPNLVHKATFEPSIALNYTISGVRLTPKVYYDLTLDGPTWELSGAHSVALARLGVTVDLNVTWGSYKVSDVSKDASPRVKNWGSYFSAGASVPFQLTSNSKLTVGWAYHEGWQNKFKQGGMAQTTNPLQASRGVVAVNYSLSF
jgi:uncharacterized protein (TIGR02001 family)